MIRYILLSIYNYISILQYISIHYIITCHMATTVLGTSAQLREHRNWDSAQPGRQRGRRIFRATVS